MGQATSVGSEALKEAATLIKRHEGVKTKPYLCSGG